MKLGFCVFKLTDGVNMNKHAQKGGAFWDALSTRDRELVDLVAGGLSNKEIAQRLGIAEGTVKIRLHVLYKKIGVSSRAQLAARVAEARFNF